PCAGWRPAHASCCWPPIRWRASTCARSACAPATSASRKRTPAIICASRSRAAVESGCGPDRSEDARGDVGQGADAVDVDQLAGARIELGDRRGLLGVHGEAAAHDLRIVVLATLFGEALGAALEDGLVRDVQLD